ncbi:3-methyl-2-oxobutanoate hydroxymethyltransferase [candidate division KSB1 bacterium]|nr:3-methyl-2-oxobutanoate hydroxymethyltransferase [candidate division KSB1 bacterium]
MKKLTIHDLHQKKIEKRPITMLTAYDYPSAKMVAEAGIDIILIGDSLAMTMLGHKSTVSVTMDEMLHHCKAVSRGAPDTFLIGDMPFLSYQTSIPEAIQNAGRFIKEAQMDAIKLEGGEAVTGTIKALVNASIPVMGHIGLTPQSITKLSGYHVQGKKAADARRLLNDALALQDAGCFAIVLEALPAPVAKTISEKLEIPTIGIGAGPGCDGQVLVFHDILGLYDQFVPKYVKQYAQLWPQIVSAIQNYRDDVESGAYPDETHSYPMDAKELDEFESGK